ncbi:hypothetical protein ABTY59_20850 [Streptomyces sp. NPDC096079]|uniref:hypothetical protein n=1 Tax=Streptomyces sp. NPDC096079 TaxID=3155820 RepID=UPI00332042E2
MSHSIVSNGWIGPRPRLPRLPFIDRAYLEQKHLAAALLLRVDPRIGLIRPDFDALAEWAAAL